MNANELNDSASNSTSLDLINIGMGLGGVVVAAPEQNTHSNAPTSIPNQFSIGNLIKSHTPPPPLPPQSNLIPQLNTPNNLQQHMKQQQLQQQQQSTNKSASKKRKLEDLGLENISDSENTTSGSSNYNFFSIF